MTVPEIFIALPVFDGGEVVAETLRSIRDQTFPHYRVSISVDGSDRASAEACRPFTADPRFSLAVQPSRLGWVGNLNWLVRACDCPFFCYWQQDDLAATNYLEQLRAELLLRPEAAIAYADVQWFGARYERVIAAGIDGSPGSRVLQAIETIHFVPLRGLIRAAWLPRREALPETVDEGCHSEFVFLARLAARGSFRRVIDTLYFKRAHARNTYARWHAWPPYRRRRAWIEMGGGFWQVAVEVIPEARYRRRLLATILDRLTIARANRAFFYRTNSDDAGEMSRFARDLLARCRLVSVPPEADGVFDPGTAAFLPPIDPDVEAALISIAESADRRRELAERLRGEGKIEMALLPGGEAASFLGPGWSAIEPWGVWNDGHEAALFLPALLPGEWQISLTGFHFADPRRPMGSPARIAWRVGDGPFRTVTVAGGSEATIDLPFSFAGLADTAPLIVDLQFPDAVYLPETGSSDPRCVGFGLNRIAIARR